MPAVYTRTDHMVKTSRRVREKARNYSVQRVNPSEGTLHDLLLREIERAVSLERVPVMACCAHWCQSCRDLAKNMGDMRMIDAFDGVHIIQVDVDDWSRELFHNKLYVRTVPHFELLNDQAQSCGMQITGAAWGDDTAGSIAPHLNDFFRRCRARE